MFQDDLSLASFIVFMIHLGLTIIIKIILSVKSQYIDKEKVSLFHAGHFIFVGLLLFLLVFIPTLLPFLSENRWYVIILYPISCIISYLISSYIYKHKIQRMYKNGDNTEHSLNYKPVIDMNKKNDKNALNFSFLIIGGVISLLFLYAIYIAFINLGSSI